MNIPFTVAQLYGVFTAYNTAVWPMQFLLLALGVLAIIFLVQQRSYSSVGISAILTALWVLLLELKAKSYLRRIFIQTLRSCTVGTKVQMTSSVRCNSLSV